MFEDFTMQTSSGNVIFVKFTHISVDSPSSDPDAGFYMANCLLTWGALYSVGSMKHKLEDGHKEDDIVLGLHSDIIYDFMRSLNKRFLKDNYPDWEFAIPSQDQWSKAFEQMRFSVEGDKRIYERTTKLEPLYSTRDNALMQERRFYCESAPSKAYPCFDGCYNTETSQCNVGIRLVLQKRDKDLEEAINIVGKAFNFIVNNRKLHLAVKHFIKIKECD